MEHTLSQTEYRIPIIQTLIKMGGKGHRADVLREVERQLKPCLSSGDYEFMKSGREVRWKSLASYEVADMKREGIMKSTAVQGLWELDFSRLLLNWLEVDEESFKKALVKSGVLDQG